MAKSGFGGIGGVAGSETIWGVGWVGVVGFGRVESTEHGEGERKPRRGAGVLCVEAANGGREATAQASGGYSRWVWTRVNMANLGGRGPEREEGQREKRAESRICGGLACVWMAFHVWGVDNASWEPAGMCCA